MQSINCIDIHLNTYNDINCSSILSKCKANNTTSGCVDKTCTDYLYTTKEDCENKKLGCTLNRDAN